MAETKTKVTKAQLETRVSELEHALVKEKQTNLRLEIQFLEAHIAAAQARIAFLKATNNV